uniref:Glutamine amidotransferase type-2 domain-containing protein n=1 Tax=Ditylenchus dipsaci TaxID=166011 RepID=A0A915EQ29_9BILA
MPIALIHNGYLDAAVSLTSPEWTLNERGSSHHFFRKSVNRRGLESADASRVILAGLVDLLQGSFARYSEGSTASTKQHYTGHCTRWNYTLAMAERLIQQRRAVETYFGRHEPAIEALSEPNGKF